MIAGIDPGKTGYIAVLEPVDESAVLKGVYKLPRLDGMNFLDLAAQVLDLGVARAFVERPGEFTPNKTVCMRQHREYAEIRAALALADVPCIDVKPRDWKQYYHLSRNKTESIVLAQKLIEGLPPLALKDDGLAEACLIGLYGWTLERYAQECLI